MMLNGVPGLGSNLKQKSLLSPGNSGTNGGSGQRATSRQVWLEARVPEFLCKCSVNSSSDLPGSLTNK